MRVNYASIDDAILAAIRAGCKEFGDIFGDDAVSQQARDIAVVRDTKPMQVVSSRLIYLKECRRLTFSRRSGWTELGHADAPCRT